MPPTTPLVLHQYILTTALLITAMLIPSVVMELYESVARVSATGRSIYVPVKREILQRRLSQFEGPTLYLPNDPVFIDQPAGTHPLLLNVGNLTFQDFVESESGHEGSSLSTSGVEIAISIPFLSHSQDIGDDMLLGLAVLYDARRGVVPRADFIYRYFPVSEIALYDSSLYVRYNNDEIRIEFGTVEGCLPDAGSPSYSFSFSYSYDDDPGLERAIFSIYGQPSFDFCLFYPFENDFCSAVAEIEEAVLGAGANVCTEWGSDDEESCDSSGEIVKVSGVFRILIPIDRPTNALAIKQYSGDYRISIGAPCV